MRTGVGPGMAGDKTVAVSSVDSPPSRTLGSEGGGPSMAQRRDSYFDRMKDSILLIEIAISDIWPVAMQPKTCTD